MELVEIKKFLDSGSGLAMRDYLTLRLNELKDITSINEKDIATQQALELKAQRRAYIKLREILQDIMTFSDPIKEKDPRDFYGITNEHIK